MENKIKKALIPSRLNIKNYFKEHIVFFIFYMVLLFLVIVLASLSKTHIEDTVISMTKSNYGKVCLTIITIVSLYSYIILRNIDKKEVKIEKIFLSIVIPIGILYCFVNPLGRIPDEERHVFNVFGVSQGVFASNHYDENKDKTFSKRAILLTSPERNVTYDSFLKNIESSKEFENEQYYPYYTTTYCFINYAPQAIGVALARLFGGDVLAQLYAGRLSNFFISIAFIYFAIKLIPFKKLTCIIIAFLPIMFNELASLSADAITNSSAIFFIAYVLYLNYKEDNISKVQYIVLLISSIIVAMCKIVYLPICLMIFILPKEKFKNNKDRFIKLGIVFIMSCALNLLWLHYTTKFISTYQKPSTDINSGEQLLFILSNPIEYIIVLIRTIHTNFSTYFFGIIGTEIGYMNISPSMIFEIPMFAMLIISMIYGDLKKNINMKTKIIATISLIAVVLLIFTSLYLQWSNVMAPRISGIQGRYFIPVLLLLAMILNSENIIINKKISYRYVLMFLVFFNLHSLTYIISAYM